MMNSRYIIYTLQHNIPLYNTRIFYRSRAPVNDCAKLAT